MGRFTLGWLASGEEHASSLVYDTPISNANVGSEIQERIDTLMGHYNAASRYRPRGGFDLTPRTLFTMISKHYVENFIS